MYMYVCTLQDLADPCAQHYVEAYLNQPEVLKVIRANTGLKYKWTRCRCIYICGSSYVVLHRNTS